MTVWDILARHGPELLNGLQVTLALCLICWSTSFLVGGLIGFAGARSPTAIGIPLRAVSALLAGVPPIVFLFWLYYPAQAVFNIVVDPFITAATAISIMGAFLVADAVRGIIADFPNQFVIAARVCGFSEREILTRITLPIAFRSFLPSALLIVVTLFQMTLFSSFISVNEIFRTAQQINSIEYRPIEVFTALAVFCMGVTLPLYGLAQFFRLRYTRDLSDR